MAPKSSQKSLPVDPRLRAQALFNLFESVEESPHWPAYITHRQNAEAMARRLMNSFEGMDIQPYVDRLYQAVQDVTSEAVKLAKDAGNSTIADDDWKKTADSVCIMSCELEDNGDGRILDANVVTRIHSPCSPRSVDVHFVYSQYTKMYSAGHDYSLGFRVNNQPAPFVHGRSLIARDRIERASQRHTRDGWRPFGWFYLDERSSIHSACTVTRGDLIDVHDALYGPSTAGTLGAAVGPRETALLLLASVGIPFNVARTEAEAHPNQYDVNDGYIVQWGGESPCLALDTPKPGLSAAHLRKICGIAPLAGDNTADLSREQVTTPDASDEDRDFVDDMDDDDEDDDMDSGDDVLTH